MRGKSTKWVLGQYALYLIGITTVVLAFDEVVFNTWFVGFGYGVISALALVMIIVPSKEEEK